MPVECRFNSGCHVYHTLDTGVCRRLFPWPRLLKVVVFSSGGHRYRGWRFPKHPPGTNREAPGARPGTTGQTFDVTNVYLRICLVADVLDGGPTSIMCGSNTPSHRRFQWCLPGVSGRYLEFSPGSSNGLEHRPPKAKVSGSRPVWGTRYFPWCSHQGLRSKYRDISGIKRKSIRGRYKGRDGLTRSTRAVSGV